MGLMFSGCGDSAPSDDISMESEKFIYAVSVKNLTLAQPMSPVALAYHDRGVSLFEVGRSASVGLEKLAEGGDNSVLLSSLSTEGKVHASKSGLGLIKPSKSETIMIEGKEAMCMSVSTMLVNTNDAFAGVSCVDVSQMKVGDKLMRELITYDAGTELNSETASSIPGPAGGGEGFNAMRDDFKNFVSVHAGIVSKDDGLNSSDLSQKHRWNNPTGMLVIERK